MAATDYSGQGQDFIIPSWHIVLGCTQVDFPQTWKDVLFCSLTLNKLTKREWSINGSWKFETEKACRQILFVGLQGQAASYGAPGIIHKLVAHLPHLASAARPWHCLLKGASVPGAVAATVSLKHHLLLHLCSHLTEKIQKEKEGPSWECRMQKYEYCLKHVNTATLTGCVCSWNRVSSVGGTRGLYIGGGHGKAPLTGGAGKRWKSGHHKALIREQ